MIQINWFELLIQIVQQNFIDSNQDLLLDQWGCSYLVRDIVSWSSFLIKVPTIHNNKKFIGDQFWGLPDGKTLIIISDSIITIDIESKKVVTFSNQTLGQIFVSKSTQELLLLHEDRITIFWENWTKAFNYSDDEYKSLLSTSWLLIFHWIEINKVTLDNIYWKVYSFVNWEHKRVSWIFSKKTWEFTQI